MPKVGLRGMSKRWHWADVGQGLWIGFCCQEVVQYHPGREGRVAPLSIHSDSRSKSAGFSMKSSHPSRYSLQEPLIPPGKGWRRGEAQ